MGYPLSIARRYLGSFRNWVVSASTILAISAVGVGVFMLSVVMSVTGGFRKTFRDKVLGVNAHVLVLKYSADFREYRDVMAKVEKVPGITGVAPFTINPMMVSHKGHTATGVLLKGVDPELMPKVLDLPRHIIAPKSKKIVGLRRPGATPAALPRPPEMSDPWKPFVPPGASSSKPAPGKGGKTGKAAVKGKGSKKPAAAITKKGTDITPEGGYGSTLPDDDDDDEDLEDNDAPPPASSAKAPTGNVVPKGGYGSKLPDDEEDDDPIEKLIPKPCEDPELRAQLPGAIVGETLAKNLHLKVGSCLQVTSPTIGYDFRGGAMRPPVAKRFRVIALFRAGFDQYDSKLIYVDLYEAQRFYNSGDSVTGVEMKVNDIEQARRISEDVKVALNNSIYHTMDWEQLNHGLFTALKIQQIGGSLAVTIVIGIAAFTVIATLIMMVLDRAREIAVLKAMGATDWAVMRIFLYQGLFIGCLGTSLGLLGGYLSCKVLLVHTFPLDPRVYFVRHVPVAISGKLFGLTALISVLLCLIATVIPAYLASRTVPADGLRPQALGGFGVRLGLPSPEAPVFPHLVTQFHQIHKGLVRVAIPAASVHVVRQLGGPQYLEQAAVQLDEGSAGVASSFEAWVAEFLEHSGELDAVPEQWRPYL